MAADQARVAAVAGATGLVGQAVLAALLTAETPAHAGARAPRRDSGDSAAALHVPYPCVHVIYAQGRKAPAVDDPRACFHAVDFTRMPQLPPLDDVFIALGTTMAAAGSKEAFRAVDHDAVLAVARAARGAGATRCGLVSAMGANVRSPVFYNRVKGEVEQALQALGFETLVIARPSLLLGDRRMLQQAPRPAEQIGQHVFGWINPLLPATYRARPGSDVAQALVQAVRTRPRGTHVISGDELRPPAVH